MFIKCITNTVSSFALKYCRTATTSHQARASFFLLNEKLGVRYAGHSKWQNIKHTKLAKDQQKSQLYNKHLDEIRSAARQGNSTNPKVNITLAKAIDNARKDGVALATINGVIEKLEKAKANPKPLMLEFRGPSGMMVIITANTDNKNRTIGEIQYFTKRCNLVRSENIRSAFDHKGYIYAKPPPDVSSDPDDKAIEDAIEFGAEEVERDQDNPEIFVFICDARDLHVIRSKLETRKYEIINSEEEYVARSQIELDEEQTKKLYEWFEKIDSIPETMGIYTNLA